MIRIALVAASRRPELLNCTPQSILSSLMQAAEVGLEPETPLQHAYLVPFKNNKNGQMEAIFLPSERGLACVAKRQGDLVAIRARLVYQNEHFAVEEGLEPKLEHVPVFDEEARGELIAGYAVAVMKDGTKEFDVMSRRDIDKVRASSRASDRGPWVDWYEMMARKTILKRLLRQLPVENEQLGRAIEHDDHADSGGASTALVPTRGGRGGSGADVIPMMTDEDVGVGEAATRAEKVAAEIKERKAKKAESDAKPSAEETTVPMRKPQSGQASLTLDEQEQIKREEREEAESEERE
jgi:recombination protein RecT